MTRSIGVSKGLEGLKFQIKFIEWVMERITTPSYSVVVNGSLHDFIKGRKGCQGDLHLLTCLLFILHIFKEC